jgi:hypothetical protein
VAVLVFWIHWRDLATWWVTGGAGGTDAAGEGRVSLFLSFGLKLLGDFQPHLLVLVFVSWARFIAWQSPLAVLLLLPALVEIRQAPYLVRMLLWSLLLTVLAHAVLMPGQSLGWGYRYLHVHLGSMALIAAWGWLRARDFLNVADRLALARMGTVLVLAGVLVALPLRTLQTESFVRPFALSDRYIRSLHADLVFIDDRNIWFGVALIHNDPLLRNSPKVMAAPGTPAEALQQICPEKTAVFLDYPTLAHLGMRERPRWVSVPEETPQTLRRNLTQNGCALIDPPAPIPGSSDRLQGPFAPGPPSMPADLTHTGNGTWSTHLAKDIQ